MAKAKVLGDALVITSTQKLEDLKMILKYRPEALVLKDEDGDEYFRVGVSDNSGIIGTYGAEFGGETHDADKKATITLMIDGSGTPEEIKADIAEDIGLVLLNIEKVEEKIPEVLNEIKAERDRILEHITVA